MGSGNIIIEGGSGTGITIDQVYHPESQNAQSGVAVAEALETTAGQKTVYGEIFNDYENNKAKAKNTHAEGANTEAGIKGIEITDITENKLLQIPNKYAMALEQSDIISIYLKYTQKTGNYTIGDEVSNNNTLSSWGLYKTGHSAYPATLNGNSLQSWMFAEDSTITYEGQNSLSVNGNANIAVAATKLEGLTEGEKYAVSFKYYIPSSFTMGSQNFIFNAGVYKENAPLTNSYTVDSSYATTSLLSVTSATGTDAGDNPVWKDASFTITTGAEAQYLALSFLCDGWGTLHFADIKVNKLIDEIKEVTAYEENTAVIQNIIKQDFDTYYIKVSPDDFIPDNYIEIINDDNTEFSTIRVLSKPTLGSRNVGMSAHSEGEKTHAYGACAHTEGQGTKAGYMSHAEGQNTHAKGKYSHTEGRNTEAFEYAHAEGASTKALGYGSHSEGTSTIAEGRYSHTEGYKSITSTDARGAHAEGWETQANGDQGSHSEGSGTKAIGTGAHAEGSSTTAEAEFSHTEGGGTHTTEDAEYAHAEGYRTTASGPAAHSEGNDTIASGAYSHAGGHGTRATAINQTAIGAFNAESEDALFIVGNGSSNDSRSNAFEVDWQGQVYIENGKKVATEDYVNNLMPKIQFGSGLPEGTAPAGTIYIQI